MDDEYDEPRRRTPTPPYSQLEPQPPDEVTWPARPFRSVFDPPRPVEGDLPRPASAYHNPPRPFRWVSPQEELRRADEGRGEGDLPRQAMDEDEQDAAKAVEAKKKNRFIVFIGNLPYTTTDEALATHFASVKPAAIRHITKPGSSNTNGFPESKGYAFVEFEDYDRLKTCLKSFHRSEFTCGGKMRQMNVELTAGGGGKGEARKEKTRAKNEKLGEERKRRMIEEAKKKAEKLESSKEEDAAAAPAAAANGWGHEDRGGMHPARMAMMSR
ncbi:hypothetical protein FH972_024122 [Carpinus fangiana]|uniref:RRM domain-containing protein n=1 Tax=Carpinus fangiana TaxID=176857 RepID=A0A5N6KZL8_9ROSI|nr:hypothetical protein FH972_024122 [Carpinus fangiana]